MKILITGSEGFIAKNLRTRLERDETYELFLAHKGNSNKLDAFIEEAEFIFHLAGVNRPQKAEEFYEGNSNLTEHIVNVLKSLNKNTPLLLSSSSQAKLDNDYGKSKRQAEVIVEEYGLAMNAEVYIYQLPNVFGKFSKPNYNTVIATWCYNMSHELPIQVNDSSTELELVYVDDVVESFMKCLTQKQLQRTHYSVGTVYHKSLGEIKELLEQFKASRENLLVPNVGSGFERALYGTYLSFLDTSDFSYALKGHEDERGTFYEIVKTLDAGQFSISTTQPGITRGNHYHDTKNEKFLVIKGEATIEHRHIFSKEIISYKVSDKKMEVVEMIPGYTHNITNTGDVEMVLLLWANERFDTENPDTYFLKV